MAMNPVKLMQIKAAIAGVERRHPNLRKFFEAVGREKLREGTEGADTGREKAGF
mgnify:CR=1 FL=1